jgi:hypothetical protein
LPEELTKFGEDVPEAANHRVVAPDRIMPLADVQHEHHNDCQHGEANSKHEHRGQQ